MSALALFGARALTPLYGGEISSKSSGLARTHRTGREIRNVRLINDFRLALSPRSRAKVRFSVLYGELKIGLRTQETRWFTPNAGARVASAFGVSGTNMQFFKELVRRAELAAPLREASIYRL